MLEKNRIFYLDSMRAILMLLGIVIHSAQVFSPQNVFPVNNGQTTIFMKYMVDTLHLFRMPAFFVVSGFFCYMTLAKYGRKQFIKLRIKRILVPLITTLFTLNLLQFLILKNENFINVSFERYISSGRYIEHLWFLVDLIYYFILTSFLHSLLQKKTFSTYLNFTLLSFPLIFLFLPFINIFIMSLNKLGIDIYSNYWGIFNPYRLMYNYIFFIFGYFMFKNKKLYNLIIYGNSTNYCVLLGISVFYYNLEKNSFLELFFHEYAYILAQWLSIALCFKVFKSLFDKPSNLSRTISESSYTVYLFHFSILLIISTYIVKLNLGPLSGFLITLFFVSFVSLLIHYKFIERFNLLKYLYNGK